jgi:hypothetical protein
MMIELNEDEREILLQVLNNTHDVINILKEKVRARDE